MVNGRWYYPDPFIISILFQPSHHLNTLIPLHNNLITPFQYYSTLLLSAGAVAAFHSTSTSGNIDDGDDEGNSSSGK